MLEFEQNDHLYDQFAQISLFLLHQTRKPIKKLIILSRAR